MRSLPGLLGDEGGAVVVIVTVLLAVLLVFAGLVIDVGHLFVVRSTLQNASDSGSLAAVASLSYGPEEARNQAQLLAQLHAVDGSSIKLIPADIELGTWDPSKKQFTVLAPAEEGNANSVRVTAQRSKDRNDPVSLFFMRVLGHETSDVRVVSVAYYQGGGLCGAIFGDKQVEISGSSSTDSYNSLEGPYISPAGDNGDVCSNGPINLSGGAQVNGDATPGPGEPVNISGGASVTGSTDPLKSKVVLPPIDLGDIATNNDNGPIPYDLEINGVEVILPGGRYYFTKFKIVGGGKLRVTGPTVFYITGETEVTAGGIVNVSQKPPDFIMLITSNMDVKLSGSSEFYGLVYAPNAKMEVSGTSDFYGMLVGDEVKVSGTSDVHKDEALLDSANFLKLGLSFAMARPILVQ